jgi:hypothetical protein
MIKLLDIRQNDGSRNFFGLPTSVTWNDLIGHLNQLEQLTIEKFLPSPVLGSWLDFSFKGYEFSVDDQMDMYWFLSKPHPVQRIFSFNLPSLCWY